MIKSSLRETSFSLSPMMIICHHDSFFTGQFISTLQDRIRYKFTQPFMINRSLASFIWALLWLWLGLAWYTRHWKTLRRNFLIAAAAVNEARPHSFVLPSVTTQKIPKHTYLPQFIDLWPNSKTQTLISDFNSSDLRCRFCYSAALFALQILVCPSLFSPWFFCIDFCPWHHQVTYKRLLSIIQRIQSLRKSYSHLSYLRQPMQGLRRLLPSLAKRQKTIL